MPTEIRNKQTDELIDVFMSLKNRDEWYKLLEDLFTIREIKDMSQRFEVAKLLKSGVTYAEIAKQTGVSSATTGRVNRALSYGTGGYQTALDHLNQINKEEP